MNLNHSSILLNRILHQQLKGKIMQQNYLNLALFDIYHKLIKNKFRDSSRYISIGAKRILLVRFILR